MVAERGSDFKEEFHGNKESWSDWKFQLYAYIHTCFDDDAIKTIMEAEHATEEIDLQQLEDPQKGAAKKLYWILARVLKGSPLALLRKHQVGCNGFEVWRIMHQLYETKGINTILGYYMQLVAFDFGSIDDIDEKINTFEIIGDKLEDLDATESVSDNLKAALLVNGCPAAIKTYIQLNPEHYKTYDTTKRAIQNWVRTQKEWKTKAASGSTTTNTDTPPGITNEKANINYVDQYKGKYKGGRDYDKGKGKGGKTLPWWDARQSWNSAWGQNRPWNWNNYSNNWWYMPKGGKGFKGHEKGKGKDKGNGAQYDGKGKGWHSSGKGNGKPWVQNVTPEIVSATPHDNYQYDDYDYGNISYYKPNVDNIANALPEHGEEEHENNDIWAIMNEIDHTYEESIKLDGNDPQENDIDVINNQAPEIEENHMDDELLLSHLKMRCGHIEQAIKENKKKTKKIQRTMTTGVDCENSDSHHLRFNKHHSTANAPTIGGFHQKGTSMLCQINSDETEMMVDSGAFTNACSEKFAPNARVVKYKRPHEAFTASGERILIVGQKIVPMWIHDDAGRRTLHVVSFEITDVVSPLMSVGIMNRHGYEFEFKKDKMTMTNDTSGTTTIHNKKGLYKLKASIAKTDEFDQLARTTIRNNINHIQKKIEEGEEKTMAVACADHVSISAVTNGSNRWTRNACTSNRWKSDFQ